MRFTSQRERRLWSAAGLCVALIYSSLYIARPIAEALRQQNLLRLAVGMAFVIAAAVILRSLLSARPGPRTFATAALIAAAYVAILSLVTDMPEERLHFLEYGVVAILIYLALTERRANQGRGISPALLATILTGLAGWIDEAIQAILPNRIYDLRDVAFNAVAGMLAVASLWLLERSRARE